MIIVILLVIVTCIALNKECITVYSSNIITVKEVHVGYQLHIKEAIVYVYNENVFV